jgi:uncharacterized protein (TIGR01244 family)
MNMAHQLDEQTLVGGQIAPADVAALKADGVTMIVNNRPDGEDVGQPTSAEIEQAARAAGIAYRHVPIARGMGPTDIEAMRDAMHAAGDGKLFAFCRSGNRSSLAWAVAKSEDGTSREALEQCLSGAGFSLGPVAHLIRT